MLEKIKKAIDKFLWFLKIEKDLSKNSVSSYSYDLLSFMNFIKLDLKCVDKDNILHEFFHYIKNDSFNTKKRKIQTVLQFLKFCKQENLFQFKFEEILINKQKVYSKFMEKEHFEILKNYLKKQKETVSNLRSLLIVDTLYCSSVRVK